MKDETGWLLELGDSPAHTPRYWNGKPIWEMGKDGKVRAEAAWTTQHHEAIRFARRLDASNVAERILKGTPVRIAEHSWSVP